LAKAYSTVSTLPLGSVVSVRRIVFRPAVAFS
jgi:hypothetical protein